MVTMAEKERKGGWLIGTIVLCRLTVHGLPWETTTVVGSLTGGRMALVKTRWTAASAMSDARPVASTTLQDLDDLWVKRNEW
jgi:hypothetical protein